jgi:hypothetical protein
MIHLMLMGHRWARRRRVGALGGWAGVHGGGRRGWRVRGAGGRGASGQSRRSAGVRPPPGGRAGGRAGCWREGRCASAVSACAISEAAPCACPVCREPCCCWSHKNCEVSMHIVAFLGGVMVQCKPDVFPPGVPAAFESKKLSERGAQRVERYAPCRRKPPQEGYVA